jgi:hypothetical protein
MPEDDAGGQDQQRDTGWRVAPRTSVQIRVRAASTLVAASYLPSNTRRMASSSVAPGVSTATSPLVAAIASTASKFCCQRKSPFLAS